VDWLREQGQEEMAYAVSFHQTKWNLPPKNQMDKCLLACDELAGFVIACCLVRPEGIATLEPKSVRKKLKDKAFAAKVDREIIRGSIETLGVDFDISITSFIGHRLGSWLHPVYRNSAVVVSTTSPSMRRLRHYHR